MSKIIKSLEKNIEMPTTIIIGDPYYFEEYPNETRLVYNKRFRGKKDWKGYLQLKEEEDTIEFDNETIETLNSSFTLILSPDTKKLETYKKGCCYSYQTQQLKEIGVDTARYYIRINDRDDKINTGGDGYWGSVIEFYNKRKLEGIIINMYFPDLLSFEECKKELEYLFNFKF